MIIVNENNCSNAYDESNDSKIKIKEWIILKNKSTSNECDNKNKIIEIVKILIITIMIITITIIINNSNLQDIMKLM